MKEIIYTSHSPLQNFQVFIRAIYTDLKVVYRIGWQLFIRNLKVQARQSLLGYAWLLLPPLVAGLVWVFLAKAKVVNTPASTVPYPVFVQAGILLWQSFVDALNCPLQQLSAARATLTKVRVPHESFVLAGAAVVLVNTLLRLVLLLGIMAWFGVPLGSTLALAPLGLAALLGLGFALGWLVALLGLLYGDVAQALGVLLSVWFLVTPVVYAPPTGTTLASWLRLNPVTPLLLTARGWLLAGPVAPSPGFWLVASGTGVGLVLAWLLYRLAQPHLIARL